MCNVLSQHEEIFRFEFGTPGFKSSLDIQSSFVEHAEGLAVYVLTYMDNYNVAGEIQLIHIQINILIRFFNTC